MKYLLSLTVGVVTGGLFTLLKLPLPAPGALQGVLGIVGIYLGFILIGFIKSIIK